MDFELADGVFRVEPAVADAALRAMRAVALADGGIERHEVALIDAVQAALAVAPSDKTITPEETAKIVTDRTARTRLVQALELVALMDGTVSEKEVAAIADFARALEVDEPRIANLRQIVRGHLRMLQLDLLRRSPMWRMGGEVLRDRGVGATWKYLTAPLGWVRDDEQSWRFRQLGLLPEGTFGRTYWAHMTSRKFGFPGEVKGFPEELVRHDLSHVLSGYDTDVPGECENAAFISGFLREDPFSYLFMITVHCHLDIEVFYDDPSQAKLGFVPSRVLPALKRGLRVKRDLYDLGWDYWADFPRPIAEVRAELGIEPLPGRP